MTIKQLSIFIENQSGTLINVLEVLKQAGIQIVASTIADTAEYGIYRMICNESQRAFDELRNAGIAVALSDVFALELDNTPGRAAEVVTKKPECLLQSIRKRYRVALVDEFQDVNELQYRFIQTLAGEEKNLFAVGDEDQTIYGFRGARQQIILGFPKEYPEAGLIRLKSCYRCSPQILEAAGRMIRCNRQRFAKQLVSLAPVGPAPELTVFPEKKDELNALAARLKALLLQGQDPAGTAVLARTRFGLRQAAAAAPLGKDFWSEL